MTTLKTIEHKTLKETDNKVPNCLFLKLDKINQKIKIVNTEKTQIQLTLL